uniref:Peptidase S1 domain-containing protein n=1 Tax=Stomoxys calcitrans TaxID=35570 RepID=A0A1I8NY20_STOCA
MKLVAILLLVSFVFGHALPLEETKDKAMESDDSRIVGGNPVDIGAYGYQISLRKKSIFAPYEPYQHICGGSIYSEKFIITAAHCIIASVASEFKVVAGSNFRTGTDGVMVPVKQILMHEFYNPQTFNNDIALLELAIPLPLNGFTIRPIELMDTAPTAGTKSTVTGWGALAENAPSPLDLNAVDVPIVSQELCNEDYKDLITDQMLCAGLRGIGGKDACQGDSGGPLAIRNKLAGVVSWGAGCARPEYPGVYANVWALRDWILEKTSQEE